MTFSNWINFLLLIVSAIAAAIAWRAVFAARASAREANEIQKRMLAIEEARERERLRAGSRTQLRCLKTRDGGFFGLVIHNPGSSRASDVRVMVNGLDIDRHEAFKVNNWTEVEQMPITLNPSEQVVLRYGAPESPEEVVSKVLVT